MCNPGNGGQRPYGRPEFENNAYRKTRARSFARENPYDDYKKFEDYMKNRQENAKRNKEAQAISNVFSVVFVIWAIYFMIRLFLHAEDMKNIERAVRIVAVRRGLPSPYVLDEYRLAHLNKFIKINFFYLNKFFQTVFHEFYGFKTFLDLILYGVGMG